MGQKIDNCSGFMKFFDIECFFAFSKGYLLEITTSKEKTEEFKTKCKERGNFDALGWVYGVDNRQNDVAFLLTEQQGPLCYYKGTVSLIVDAVVHTNNTILKDVHRDLRGFSAIDFSGEPVNSVFSPKEIFGNDKRFNRTGIEWLLPEDYAKSFNTEIQGKKCIISFAVIVDRSDLDPDKLSLGSLNSFIRLEFEERQDMSFIIKCWESVCSFLSFCVGSFNVTDLDVGLWDESQKVGLLDIRGPICCCINHEEVESVHFEHSPYYRFQVCYLDEKVGALFSLLNDEKNKPVLKFLPKTKTDIAIDRNKIRELCTSLEVEYDYNKRKFSYNKLDNLVESLKGTVKQYKKEHIGEIEDNEYSYIFGSLNHISCSARRKIILLYERYCSIIKEVIEKNYILESEKVDLSIAQTEKDIGWIVTTRNNLTHNTGVNEDLIPNAIFFRLKLVVYCSILERSGYPLEEIESILYLYASGGWK